jgi:transposase
MGRKSKCSPEEKVQIVLAGIKAEKSIARICRDYEITQTTYYRWRDQFLEAAKEAFRGKKRSNNKSLKNKIDQLQKTIGKLTVENEILKKQKR